MVLACLCVVRTPSFFNFFCVDIYLFVLVNVLSKFYGCTYSSVSSAIEDDYTGPKLEDGKVTEKFVKDLMQTFKDQKGLHKKYAYKVSP